MGQTRFRRNALHLFTAASGSLHSNGTPSHGLRLGCVVVKGSWEERVGKLPRSSASVGACLDELMQDEGSSLSCLVASLSVCFVVHVLLLLAHLACGLYYLSTRKMVLPPVNKFRGSAELGMGVSLQCSPSSRTRQVSRNANPSRYTQTNRYLVDFCFLGLPKGEISGTPTTSWSRRGKSLVEV